MASTLTRTEIPTPLSGSRGGKPRYRRRFAEMSDAELLRFGMTAKYACSLESRADHLWLELLEAQLSDARAEWQRRHPMLPLSISL